MALNEVKGENIIEDNTYDVIELNNNYKISMKGKYPTSGNIVINKRQVESANICINDYIVKYENNKAEVLNKCNSENEIENVDASNVEYGDTTLGEALDDLREKLD